MNPNHLQLYRGDKLSNWFLIVLFPIYKGKLFILLFLNRKWNNTSSIYVWNSLWWPLKMAGHPVKLFLFIQNFCRAIGIHLPYSRKNVIFLICLAQSVLSTLAFLLSEAKSVVDFGTALFFLSTLVLAMALYLILIWKMENISKFIENCEAFIETSKYETPHWILALSFSNDVCHFDRIANNERIQWIDWENWKTLQMVLHFYLIFSYVLCVFNFDFYRCQLLLHLFGRRIILSDFFDCVCN